MLRCGVTLGASGKPVGDNGKPVTGRSTRHTSITKINNNQVAAVQSMASARHKQVETHAGYARITQATQDQRTRALAFNENEHTIDPRASLPVPATSAFASASNVATASASVPPVSQPLQQSVSSILSFCI